MLSRNIRSRVSSLRQVASFSSHSPSSPKASPPADDFSTARPFSELPGPNLWDFFHYFRPGGALYGKAMLDVQREFSRRYGKLCKMPGLFGKDDIVFVYEPDDIEKIYRSEGVHPTRHLFHVMAYHRNVWRKDFYSKSAGLTSSQGEDWWRIRQALNPVMMKPNAMKRYVPKMDEIVNDYLALVEQKRGGGGGEQLPRDFLASIYQWALETIGYITFDIRIGLLGDQENPMANQFLNNVRMIFQHTYKLDVLPSIWKWYKTPLFKEAMQNLDELNTIALHFLQQGKQVLEEKRRLNRNSDEDKSIFEQLLDIDENIALIMSTDSVIAGVDASSSTMFNLMYALARHPEKQHRLREELRQCLPERDSPLTAENMRNMPYLRACMKESIRLSPILDNFRSAGRDMVLQGYHVPKDTQFVFVQELLLKDNAHFEDADKFLPERFLRKAKNDNGCPYKDPHPFIYLPFGFGPRMCIGRRIAELEMESLIAKFIRRYEVGWNGPPPTYYSSVANIPVGDTYFTIKDVSH